MILHVDMDAFYASVEERENANLVGRPLVVGGQPGTRGVVSAANYAARKFGVFSAMPISTALAKCPQLVIIKPRMNLYIQVSKDIRKIFERFTPIIEPLSLDEAFLDATGSEKLYGNAKEIGLKIKTRIKQELQLVASVGVAPNKFLAKLASDHKKPDGFTVVEEDGVMDFLDPMPITRLWGVGRVSAKKLHGWGVQNIGDFRQHSAHECVRFLGKDGRRLWQLAHGIDHRKVTTDSVAKSISQETTFTQDITDITVLQSTLMNLVESVGYRLRHQQLKALTIQVKLRHKDFSTVTRAKTLQNASQSTSEIWQVADRLMLEYFAKKPFSIRLVGMAVSNFSQQGNRTKLFQQMDLFNAHEEEIEAQSNLKIDKLTDQIKNKFGKDSIKRGKGIK